MAGDEDDDGRNGGGRREEDAEDEGQTQGAKRITSGKKTSRSTTATLSRKRGSKGSSSSSTKLKTTTTKATSSSASSSTTTSSSARKLKEVQQVAIPQPPQFPPIRFRTHFVNSVFDVMSHFGWKQVLDDSWDVYWCDVGWVREHFDGRTLADHARVCHFPTHYELTRKDHMAKNLKKMRRRVEKEEGKGAGKRCDFLPATYWLPHDWGIFAEEFKRRAGTVWIMKPVGSAQGKGIFLITKLSELMDFRRDNRFDSREGGAPEKPAYIVQQYLSNPFLVGGKKFDLRIYVLVTSFNPLTFWLYREGFARFSQHPFSMDDLSNTFVHLTNVAIQKTAKDYDKGKGCKWLMSQVKRYIKAMHGADACDAMLADIDNIILTSLQAVQPVMFSDKHCFELYGYDIMIDADLKPWLIEVNASPSLTADTGSDYKFKYGLLEDMFTVLNIDNRRCGDEVRVGGFDLVYQDGLVHYPFPEAAKGTSARVSNSNLGGATEDRKENLLCIHKRLLERDLRQQQKE